MTGLNDGPKRRADALDLLDEQDHTLDRLVGQWTSSVQDTAETTDAWDRGTIGKLILEHAAIRAAAAADVARVLADGGRGDLAGDLSRHAAEVRGLIDRLDKDARGVAPIAVARDTDFAATVDNLGRLVSAQRAERTTAGIAEALGTNRSRLRSARLVGKHAPLHPALRHRWYHRIPGVVRAHALYDALRGHPSAETNPDSNEQIAFDADHPLTTTTEEQGDIHGEDGR